MQDIPVVAVSACLLGQPVRYDGKAKYTALIAQELARHCRLIAVCPEMAIGLGVPRDKIQLTQIESTVKVLKTTDLTADVTQALVDFSYQFVKQQAISGMVLQDKSPSCGIDNVKLYTKTGELIGLSSGMFALTVQDLLVNMPIVQASQLRSKIDVEYFVQQVSDFSVGIGERNE